MQTTRGTHEVTWGVTRSAGPFFAVYHSLPLSHILFLSLLTMSDEAIKIPQSRCQPAKMMKYDPGSTAVAPEQ